MQLLLVAGTVTLTVLAFLKQQNFKSFSKSTTRIQRKLRTSILESLEKKNPESLMPRNP